MSDFACPRKGHASHSSNTAPGYEVGKTTKKGQETLQNYFQHPTSKILATLSFSSAQFLPKNLIVYKLNKITVLF
jgi:hypothetical protein